MPLGLVVAATLSLWVELDPAGLENASREFGVGAAAAESAVKALDRTERSAGILLLTGLVFRAWLTVGAVRALLLAYAPARELQPPRIRRPLHAIAVFNGLFLLHAFGVAGVAWLHEHVGATAVVSTVVTLARETAIVLCAMWLLPRRATRMRELLPGAALSPSVGSCSRSR